MGQRRFGHGEFTFPHDVASDCGAGNIYVVDAAPNRVQKFLARAAHT